MLTGDSMMLSASHRFSDTLMPARYIYEDGLALAASNPDTVELGAIRILPNAEFEVAISGMVTSRGDTTAIHASTGEAIELTHVGGPTSYSVRMKVAGDGLDTRAAFDNIKLQPNSSHRFEIWKNGTASEIVVLVDNGRDGSIDETIRISSSVQEPQGGALSMGGTVMVAPNPLTADGSMTVTLSHGGRLRATLHDNLGRELRTIADASMAAGTHRLPLGTIGLVSGLYHIRVLLDGVPVGAAAVNILK
jgi:hypothetical protein